MRRRWTLRAALLMLSFGLVDALSAGFTHAEIRARSVTLLRAEDRFPVWLPDSGEKSQPLGAAVMTADQLRYFGRIRQFRTPWGETVTCDHLFYWMWCDGGWQVERG